MKGSFYTLEAAIASIMMIMTLVFVFQRSPDILELSKANYKVKIYDALKISDDTGDLRKNVMDNNALSIESDLNSYIPIYLDYNVTIYNKTSNLTDVPSISSENVITVSYFLAGRVGNYAPKEVRVFLWGFE
jgi:hypothetical protein